MDSKSQAFIGDDLFNCDTHFHMHAINVTVSVAADTTLCLKLVHALLMHPSL